MKFFERLLDHARMLMDAGLPVVLAGDYNVVPTALDVYPAHALSENALLQPQPRSAFEQLLAQGWCDALRTLDPSARLYTFWDYKRDRFARDDGLRLDHLLLSPVLTGRLSAGGVDRDVRAAPDASDHAPAWIALSKRPAPRRRAQTAGRVTR